MPTIDWSKEPPRTPGAYWWRESAVEDEANIFIVEEKSVGRLTTLLGGFRLRVDSLGGEWLPVSEPERILELLAIERDWVAKGGRDA